jgi:hypothetical protein
VLHKNDIITLRGNVKDKVGALWTSIMLSDRKVGYTNERYKGYEMPSFEPNKIPCQIPVTAITGSERTTLIATSEWTKRGILREAQVSFDENEIILRAKGIMSGDHDVVVLKM